ncbi:MAG: DUF1566 domain-containing protein [Thermodesulfobacteriota bacterium]
MRVLFLCLLAGLLALFTSVAGFSGPGATATAEAFESLGTRCAVCIGISDYKDPDLADLPFARNDARELAVTLRDYGGFDRVQVFTDDHDSKDPGYPSRKNILAGLDEIRSRLGRDALVLFFFSGHGVTDPGGRRFLLPADAMVQDIPSTAISLETVQQFLAAGEPGRGILFLDAARPEIRSKGPTLQGIYPDRYLRDRVSTVFYAAEEDAFSHDHEKAPYGVFGAALIAGIQGEADREVRGDNDGVVSIMELGVYVDEKLNEWSMESGKPQSPYIRIFDRRVATLALTRAGDSPDERVLAAVRIKPPDVPEDIPAPPQVEAPAQAERPEPAGPTSAPSPVARQPLPVERPEPADRVTLRAEPEKPESREIVIGEQAPGISDVEVEEPVASSEEPPPASRPAPASEADRKAMDFEFEEREREDRIVSSDDPAAAASLPDAAPKEVKPETTPPAAPPEPVSLRSRPEDLSEEGVRSLLLENDFYATCWTYNGDFCNPNGEFINSYRDNGDGTVTDDRTRLMWQKGGSPSVMDWPEAGTYVQKLNRERFAGYDDWRLPTVEELASLMERSWLNDDLFVAAVFSSAQKYCWSADTKGVERAWKSNFHLGFFLDFPISDLSAVRAVRSLR